MLALARELKAENQSRIHLYCFNVQEVQYYERMNDDGVFETINDANVLLRSAFENIPDENAVFDRARQLEKRVGITLNHLAVPDRHFGRGYALAGPLHPRSRYSESVDYPHIVHAFCAALEFWEQEFNNKKISVCLNGTREAQRIAQQMGIPYRVLVLSRYKNFHYWAWNDFFENPLIQEKWNTLTAADRLTMDKPYFAHSQNRLRWQKMFRFTLAVSNAVKTTLRYVYWNIRGYEKAKGYYYRETILHHFRLWAGYKQMRRWGKARLADLKGKRFVYFPMHVEPETALHGLSPEYFYQHALIAAVSRDLPAGVYLAVKEAYGSIGRRPKDFYRLVADLKNVIWLDVWEPGLDCVKQSEVVVTICGTAGLEAAALGKPVIAFGSHNIYNFLPSVKLVEDEADLTRYLRDALDQVDENKIRAEGERLLRAIVDVSFDMGSYDYIELNNFEGEVVERARLALVESLASEEALA